MKPLNWNNLRRNKCPKCCKELDFTSDQNIGSGTEMMMCTISCGFMISVQKMTEICIAGNNRKITYSSVEGTTDTESIFETTPKIVLT